MDSLRDALAGVSVRVPEPDKATKRLGRGADLEFVELPRFRMKLGYLEDLRNLLVWVRGYKTGTGLTWHDDPQCGDIERLYEEILGQIKRSPKEKGIKDPADVVALKKYVDAHIHDIPKDGTLWKLVFGHTCGA